MHSVWISRQTWTEGQIDDSNSSSMKFMTTISNIGCKGSHVFLGVPHASRNHSFSVAGHPDHHDFIYFTSYHSEGALDGMTSHSLCHCHLVHLEKLVKLIQALNSSDRCHGFSNSWMPVSVHPIERVV